MRIAVLGLALAAAHAAPHVSDAQAADMTWREHRAADDESLPIEPDKLFVRENTKPFGIVRGSGANFKARVLRENLCTAVLFYAPWDVTCQRIAPAWRRAALALEGEVRMVVVNTENQTNGRLRQKYNIQVYPTILIFGWNKKAPYHYHPPFLAYRHGAGKLNPRSRASGKATEGPADGHHPDALRKEYMYGSESLVKGLRLTAARDRADARWQYVLDALSSGKKAGLCLLVLVLARGCVWFVRHRVDRRSDKRLPD